MKKLPLLNEYLFILGRTPALARAEIEAVLQRGKVDPQIIFSSPELLHLGNPAIIEADKLIQTLGGTVKMAEVTGKIRAEEKNILVNKIAAILKDSQKEGERLTFGLSLYGPFQFNQTAYLTQEIKAKLVSEGLKVRFIKPQEAEVLSSVVVKKQKVSEIILVRENNQVILAKTLAVQDFEDWARRDFGRPEADPHRGMLPPKVARMMLNLSYNLQAPSSNINILDPFCGVGTILAEGMILGLNVIGGDQSPQALEKTRKNLEWLVNNYHRSSNIYNLIKSEATHISEKLSPGSIDAIVTEPYLGPNLDIRYQKLDSRNINNIILGLEKLYLGCLRNWYKVLKDGGKIVIALPSFKITGREVFVKRPIDICENLGYTLLTGPYQYSRPQAVVIRNIYVLQKKYLS